MAQLLFYPCVIDNKTGRINKVVGEAMKHDDAADYLRKQHNRNWLLCEALPQPVTHRYFTDPTYEHYVGVEEQKDGATQ